MTPQAQFVAFATQIFTILHLLSRFVYYYAITTWQEANLREALYQKSYLLVL